MSNAMPEMPELPPVLQPGPYPFMFGLDTAQMLVEDETGTGLRTFIVLHLMDRTGQKQVWFNTEMATGLLEQLERLLPAARSGLVLPR